MNLSIEDLHKTKNDLIRSGRDMSDVEGILVNTEELSLLLHDFERKYKQQLSTPSAECEGNIRIFGVNIIPSRYVPRGSMYPVFKHKNGYAHAGGTFSAKWNVYGEEPPCIPYDTGVKRVVGKEEKRQEQMGTKKYSDKRPVQLD